MEKLCKSVALKTALKAVGSPMGHGTSWLFHAPYDAKKLNGPTTTIQASSYPAIVRRRSQCVVQIALELMGIVGDLYVDELDGGGAYVMLNRVLADQQRYIIPREA